MKGLRYARGPVHYLLDKESNFFSGILNFLADFQDFPNFHMKVFYCMHFEMFQIRTYNIEILYMSIYHSLFIM